MDLKLVRSYFDEDGVFGVLSSMDGSCNVAVTLEHAYWNDEASWEPKIPTGTYQCQRGIHQLEGMDHPFETFEIMNVPDHTNILFHMETGMQIARVAFFWGLHGSVT